MGQAAPVGGEDGAGPNPNPDPNVGGDEAERVEGEDYGSLHEDDPNPNPDPNVGEEEGDGSHHADGTLHTLTEAGRKGMCHKPGGWCVHDGATNVPSRCGGIPGHYCHDTSGQSGFFPCDKHIPATWGTGVQCLESSCACSSTCSRDATLRSASGHCCQAVDEGAACTHERLFAPSQPGVGIVVLERNEVYRVNDIVYCSSKAPEIACTRARLDARTIMCEEMYRGTLLRRMLAETCKACEACDNGCERASAVLAEPIPGFSYQTQRDAAQAQLEMTQSPQRGDQPKFLAMGGPGPRLEALARILQAGRAECVPATAEVLVVPVRMGDKIPQQAEEVLQSVQRALKNPKRRGIRSVVFNAVMHYGHNVLKSESTDHHQWVRTPASDEMNLRFVDELFRRAASELRVPATLRSEPSVDRDLCYLVHSPQVLITAEDSATHYDGGSFPVLVGELRSRAGAQQRGQQEQDQHQQEQERGQQLQ